MKLPKKVKDFYSGNCKTVKKDIEDDRTWNDFQGS
jgi:hypothetical protein